MKPSTFFDVRVRLPFAPLVLALFLVGCAVGPDYERPKYPMPAAFRGDEAPPAPPEASTFGDLRWAEVYRDPALERLVREAVESNYEARIAAERVMRARQEVIAARSSFYPSLDVSAGFEGVRASREGLTPPAPGGDATNGVYFLQGALSWEIDLFGRIRRSVEAAQADLLTAEETRRAILQMLVNDLAQAYLELRELDLELAIARRTADSRRESLQLVSYRFDFGYDGLTSVRMAENLYYTATKAIPDIERRMAFKEHQICLLLGRNPGPIERGLPLIDQPLAAEAPPGLPSTLLERRPDIRAAEQALVAANARIGVAKANRFPRIALTAAGGYESTELSNLLSRDAGFWDVVAGATAPVFNAGLLQANQRAAEAAQRETALSYARTIQQALRETSDALAAVRLTREARIEQQKQTAAVADQVQLANMRYYGGETSFLEVLDSERQLFDVELSLARANLDELVAVVSLYRALGGGWEAGVKDAVESGGGGAP